MQPLFLVFCLLLPLCSSVVLEEPIDQPYPPTSPDIPAIQELVDDLVLVNNKLKTDVNLLKSSVMKCEQGFLYSDPCNPPSHECFNKQKTAQFTLPFTETPTVTMGFVRYHVNAGGDIRINMRPRATEVTATSVTVNFKCSGDSVCTSAAISWMACGTVPL